MKTKRVSAFLLAFLMLLSMLPTGAFASELSENPETMADLPPETVEAAENQTAELVSTEEAGRFLLEERRTIQFHYRDLVPSGGKYSRSGIR